MTDSTHQETPTAIVVPGSDYKLALPELDSPVLDLVSAVAPEELVRVAPRTDGYRVQFRPAPNETWETLTRTKSMPEAVQKAACVQEFNVQTERDLETGLVELYLSPDDAGGVRLDSRDHFPLHLVRTKSDLFSLGTREFLIEAPNAHHRAAFGQPGYTIKTRTEDGGSWQLIHSEECLVSPAVVLQDLGTIAGVSVWTSDLDTDIKKFVADASRPSRDDVMMLPGNDPN